MSYPALDRASARRDRSVIDAWCADVSAAYERLTAHGNFFSPTGGESPANDLSAFEQAARDDREWAEGYLRGLNDALRGADESPQGPGVMAPDPKDGWSPSITRVAGYEAGREDGRHS